MLVPTDGSGTPGSPPYALAAGLGIHQADARAGISCRDTPGIHRLAVRHTFAINSATQFRSPPGQIFNIGRPPVRQRIQPGEALGDARVRGAFPNSQQSEIARFWPGGGAGLAQQRASHRRGNRALDRWQHARMFALMNMSVADSMITNIESKYFYNFWRPVTAIRWANDGNPNTQSDPTWRPFLQTPPYPDYPCASTSVTGAAPARCGCSSAPMRWTSRGR